MNNNTPIQNRRYTLYAIAFLLLLASHFFLTGWLSILFYAILGIGLAVLLPADRYVLVKVLLAEIIIAGLFAVVIWNKEQLKAFSINFSLSPFLIILGAVVVNTVTAFLCTGAAFHLTKWMAQYGRGRKHSQSKEKVKTPMPETAYEV
ncbi:hypothetical protein D3H65_11455 [Paraflavitalea soli]|uniref:Uncharacterized protein n=1 Tax=Paraflavitalea soli TaxID=2315862 RepID=A0A3B7MNM1_9BACT|nr:hypothetical protein [Paraflavitalea soli]AXY74556.1 hypothetical protein D3H65_11455 [Paraflavitalea soli]